MWAQGNHRGFIRRRQGSSVSSKKRDDRAEVGMMQRGQEPRDACSLQQRKPEASGRNQPMDPSAFDSVRLA